MKLNQRPSAARVAGALAGAGLLVTVSVATAQETAPPAQAPPPPATAPAAAPAEAAPAPAPEAAPAEAAPMEASASATAEVSTEAAPSETAQMEETMPPAEEPMPAADPMAPAEPAPEPVAEEDSGPTAWFRIDNDGLGTQLWAGATNSVGGLDIATDIYVVGTFGEFDIGPAFSVGDLALLPMIGMGFDWGVKELGTVVVPQLFTIYDGPIYFESWIQGFLNSPFDYDAGDGVTDTLYTRDFLLLKLTDDFHVGPQIEATIALNDAAGDGLISLPIGGRINYNARGDWDSLIGLFVGVETQEDSQTGDNLAGRFTYLHFF